jgi:hypothetical protein
MTYPTLDDLNPPPELVRELRERNSFWLEDIAAAYRAGAEQAAERLKGQWPTPITDRLPTEADGYGVCGHVQFFSHGEVIRAKWSAYTSGAWLHCPGWQPPAPPTLKEQALADIDKILSLDIRLRIDVVNALDTAKRALEDES